MGWSEGECDEHGPLVNHVCPECPTEEDMLAIEDFAGIAFRVLDVHEHGGYSTKAHYLGEAMKRCFEAGRRTTSPRPVKP